MGVEKRTQEAITLTRSLLAMATADPNTVILMTVNDIKLQALEDMVYDILDYLDKTKPVRVMEVEAG